MPRKPTKQAEKLSTALAMAAALAVEDLWRRILGSGLAEYARLSRAGATQDEIARRVATALEGLSTKPDELLAREASTVAYGEGRAAELIEAKRGGAVTFALRSELLDEATCLSCATLDGAVVEIGSPEYDELKPPARCEGRERCRGFYVAVPREAA